MTIRDFLELCTVDAGYIAVYNLNTEETTISELGMLNIYATIGLDALNAELISWDFIEHEGQWIICLNYEM